MTIDYKNINLKVGLELHMQLETGDKNKLFCKCSAEMKGKTPKLMIKRKLHPVASELGSVDQAAQYEYLRNRTFSYQVFPKEVCMVCTDDEPPHELNKEALDTALQISMLLDCYIPDELHTMRKTVLDGSAITSFQRTIIIGTGGRFSYKGRKIEVTQITLEEDAAAIVSEENGVVTYRLNRLGIPLVEIDTGILEGFTPEDVQDIAYTIGLIAKSTGKIRRGIGSIRQDVNVSIRGGGRVEVKGVQELGMLAKVVDLEARRQLELVNSGNAVEKETRAAKEDGTTVFTRPLPGAARMYPESDVLPIVVDEKRLSEIKKALPEPWDRKITRFREEFKLSELLAKEIVRSDYLEPFEGIMKKFSGSFGNNKLAIEKHATRMANLLTNIMKNLRREGYKTDNIPDGTLLFIYGTLVTAKESDENVIKELSCDENVNRLHKNPEDRQLIYNIFKKLELGRFNIGELKSDAFNSATSLLKSGKELKKNILMGEVMKKYRGKADGKVIAEVVETIIKEFKQ